MTRGDSRRHRRDRGRETTTPAPTTGDFEVWTGGEVSYREPTGLDEGQDLYGPSPGYGLTTPVPVHRLGERGLSLVETFITYKVSRGTLVRL